jgi:DNA-binding MarR family transcriptional regulator
VRLLARQDGIKRCDLSEITRETNIDKDKMRKVINILIDLGLIERSDSGSGEGYKIPSAVEKEVSQGIRKVCG